MVYKSLSSGFTSKLSLSYMVQCIFWSVSHLQAYYGFSMASHFAFRARRSKASVRWHFLMFILCSNEGGFVRSFSFRVGVIRWRCCQGLGSPSSFVMENPILTANTINTFENLYTHLNKNVPHIPLPSPTRHKGRVKKAEHELVNCSLFKMLEGEERNLVEFRDQSVNHGRLVRL